MDEIDHKAMGKELDQPSKLDTAKNNATIFEIELYHFINKYIKGGLSKPDLIAKLEYILKSCKLS